MPSRSWPWSERPGESAKLPLIPLPLEPPDADAPLDLQSAFESVYEDAGYDYSLDYRHGATPPLAPPDADWAAKLIEAARPS